MSSESDQPSLTELLIANGRGDRQAFDRVMTSACERSDLDWETVGISASGHILRLIKEHGKETRERQRQR
jgi:hypothetical protein